MNVTPTEQLRMMDLEDAIELAANTIQHLVHCLSGRASHSYPSQTERTLDTLRALTPPRTYCAHSGFVEHCDSCRRGREERERRWTLRQAQAEDGCDVTAGSEAAFRHTIARHKIENDA